jgi:hypothetical protein
MAARETKSAQIIEGQEFAQEAQKLDWFARPGCENTSVGGWKEGLNGDTSAGPYLDSTAPAAICQVIN